MSDEASIDHMLLAVAEKIKCQGQDHEFAHLLAGITHVTHDGDTTDPGGAHRSQMGS
jgi:hypothetical protein